MKYDATASWSGYQYQGKVALYCALEKIIEIRKKYLSNEVEKIREEIEKYKLEIENLEDFSIKFNNNYKSAHQVKAYTTGSHTLHRYSDTILKMYDNPFKIRIYLHIIDQPKNWTSSSLEKSLNTKISDIEERLKVLENDEKSKLNNKKKIENLKAEKNKVLIYKTEIDKILDKVRLYEYYDDNNILNQFCSLNDIEIKIHKKILELCNLLDMSELTDPSSISIQYTNLIGKIDEHVRDRHQKKCKNYIDFSTILNMFNNQLLQRESKYITYIIKNILLGKFIDFFCGRCEKKSKELCINENIGCIILKLIDDVSKMEYIDFEDFIRKFNPHKIINKIDDYTCYEFLQKNEIFSLYSIIAKMNVEYELNKKRIMYKNGIDTYIATTILAEEGYEESDCEEICKSIFRNEVLLEDLYENTAFITKNVDVENIFDTFINVEEIEDEEVEELKSKHIFNNSFSLKSLKSVKEKFSDD